MAGQAQGEGQGPLLTLGGVGPGRQAAEGDDQVVAVGPDGGHPTAQVVAAGRGQRAVQRTGPAALVARATWAARSATPVVDRPPAPARGARRAPPGRGHGRAGLGQLLRPTRRGW